MLNLVLNAADAAGAKARILVSVAGDGPGRWVIAVEDNGPGVPEPLRADIFEPFFTTKPDGTGLGLASAVACSRFHGGSITVDGSPLGGARFRMTLADLSKRDDAPGTSPSAS